MFLRNISSLRQRISNRFTLTKARFQLPEKWKGGRIEQWSLYWENLVKDYKEVAKEVIVGAQQRPYKAAFITSGLGVMYAAMKTNPNDQAFRASLVHYSSLLCLVGEPVRNPVCDDYVRYLYRLIDGNYLNYMNLIFLTVLWVSDYSRDNDIYATQCSYLKPRYLTFHERIVDVGMFGTWWNLRRKMVDYDVNPNEWETAKEAVD